tara:strand:+ start:1112 stop:1318 length:207 start_codon:yes stop_codon:yes gene_type:complete
MKTRNILEDLSTCHQKSLEIDLHIEQAETLGRAIDLAIELDSQLLINELHRCLKATTLLNTIHLNGLE